MIIFYLNSRLIIFSVSIAKTAKCTFTNKIHCNILWETSSEFTYVKYNEIVFKKRSVLLVRETYVTYFCTKQQIKNIPQNKKFCVLHHNVYIYHQEKYNEYNIFLTFAKI